MRNSNNLKATLAEIAAQCHNHLPLPEKPEADIVFSEPWQAQAFAMTVALHQQGVFTWAQWAQALSNEIKQDKSDDGSQYYHHWLNALEQLVLTKNLAIKQELHLLEDAWQLAIENTPHGQPLEINVQHALSQHNN